MKTFNTVQEIQNERTAQRGNAIIYTLLGVLIGEIDRLPTRDNPTPDQIYKEVNKLYNNAKEMSIYKEDSKVEMEYLKDYIKQQFTVEELTDVIVKLKNDGCKNIGDFMKTLNSQYKGQFDGKMASGIINKILKEN